MIKIVWPVCNCCFEKGEFAIYLRNRPPADINPLREDCQPAPFCLKVGQTFHFSVYMDIDIALRCIQGGDQPLQDSEIIVRDDEPGVVHCKSYVIIQQL